MEDNYIKIPDDLLLSSSNINIQMPQLSEFQRNINSLNLVPQSVLDTVNSINMNIPTPQERMKFVTDRMDDTNEILQEQNEKIDKLQEALNKSQVIN